MPFFEYDHIHEFSEVQEHTSDNLVLLCPNHHAAKTTHKLSVDRIREAKSNPFNSKRQFTTGLQLERAREITVRLGSNQVGCVFPDGHGIHNAIWINGKSFLIIHADSHWLSTSLRLTDAVGHPLLIVDRGELIASTAPWDYTYEGENLKVRSSPGEVLLDMNLSDLKVEVLKGTFLDSNTDGFIVENCVLFKQINGVRSGAYVGCISLDNRYGGWGMLNAKAYPEVQKPRGFGFFG